jgi:hypothetical protein
VFHCSYQYSANHPQNASLFFAIRNRANRTAFGGATAALQIAKENESKGIPDVFNDRIGSPIRGLRSFDVCYSITHKPGDAPGVDRQCEKTEEVVMVPGDLDVPPDFWGNYRSRCDQTKGLRLEVALNGRSSR